MSLVLAPFLNAEQDFLCHMIVGKAFLNSPRPKQSTESQQSLASFLARKRESYQASRRGRLAKRCASTGNTSTTNISYITDTSSQNTSWDDGEKNIGDSLALVHRRNCILNLTSLNVRPLKDHRVVPPCHLHRSVHTSLVSQHAGNKTIGDDFIELDSAELAERVVTRAKVRLKQRKKRARMLQEVYQPVPKVHQGRVPIIRSSTPVDLSLSSSPVKEFNTIETKTRKLSRNTPLESEGCPDLKAPRRIVYLSERQSLMSKDAGIPNVPPSTPVKSKLVNVIIIISYSHVIIGIFSFLRRC